MEANIPPLASALPLRFRHITGHPLLLQQVPPALFSYASSVPALPFLTSLPLLPLLRQASSLPRRGGSVTPSLCPSNCSSLYSPPSPQCQHSGRWFTLTMTFSLPPGPPPPTPLSPLLHRWIISSPTPLCLNLPQLLPLQLPLLSSLLAAVASRLAVPPMLQQPPLVSPPTWHSASTEGWWATPPFFLSFPQGTPPPLSALASSVPTSSLVPPLLCCTCHSHPPLRPWTLQMPPPSPCPLQPTSYPRRKKTSWGESSASRLVPASLPPRVSGLQGECKSPSQQLVVGVAAMIATMGGCHLYLPGAVPFVVLAVVAAVPR